MANSRSYLRNTGRFSDVERNVQFSDRDGFDGYADKPGYLSNQDNCLFQRRDYSNSRERHFSRQDDGFDMRQNDHYLKTQPDHEFMNRVNVLRASGLERANSLIRPKQNREIENSALPQLDRRNNDIEIDTYRISLGVDSGRIKPFSESGGFSHLDFRGKEMGMNYETHTRSNQAVSDLRQSNLLSDQRDHFLGQEQYSLARNPSNLINYHDRNSDPVNLPKGGNPRKTFINPWQTTTETGDRHGIQVPSGGSSNVASSLTLRSNITSLLQTQNPAPIPSLMASPVTNPQSTIYGAQVSQMNRLQQSGLKSRSGGGDHRHNSMTFRSRQPAIRSTMRAELKSQDSRNGAISKNSKRVIPNNPRMKKTGPIDKIEKMGKLGLNSFRNINIELLKCHICTTEYNCGKDFAEHLLGEKHKAVMEEKQKLYLAKVADLRNEIKLANEKVAKGKGTQLCIMCNVQCNSILEHRTTRGHKKLKKFLHPICKCCSFVAPSKIAMDEHLLHPSHLKLVQLKAKNTTNNTSSEQKTQKTSNKAENADSKDKVKVEKEEDPDQLVLDYVEGDDFTGVTDAMIPRFNENQGVGESFIAEYRCLKCKLCNKILDNQEEANVHVKTRPHHNRFARFVSQKIKEANQSQEKSAADNAPKAASKRSHDSPSDDSVDAKKIKTKENNKDKTKDVVDLVVLSSDEEENDTAPNDDELPNDEELEDW